MRDVDQDTHDSEVKTIAQRNQGDRDDMMHNKLSEILASRLQPEDHDERLLRPERRLQEIVELHAGRVRLVRIPLVHVGGREEGGGEEMLRGAGRMGVGVGVVHHRPRHVEVDVDAQGPHDARVDGHVHLLVEPAAFAA